MSNLSLSGAELIALIIGAVLYGIYLVTLGIAGRSLLMTETGQWKRRSAINWVIVVVSAVLFVNGTLNLIVASITVYQAFVVYTGPGGPEHIFTHGSGWQTITKVGSRVSLSLALFLKYHPCTVLQRSFSIPGWRWDFGREFELTLLAM
jgi:hypothetical protein